MSELQPGMTIGRYEILEILGQGGMATVFRAFDTRLEREVAIKLIRTEMFPPAILRDVLARFEREAKALARLDHHNILRVFDFGEHEGVPYLVMAYVSGGSLRDLIHKAVESGSPPSIPEAAGILAPIARALAYAHSRNIIHRDVKPANILLNDRSEPLLGDFGIAKILDSGGAGLTGSGLTIGTPEYMAPEQSAGDSVDARVDIYALGVVFYEMISGRRPFEGTTPLDVLIKIRTAPLTPIREYLPDATEAVQIVLDRALARETAERYASMALFAADLEALASGEPLKSAAAPATQPDEEATVQTPVSASKRRTAAAPDSGDTIQTPTPEPPKAGAPRGGAPIQTPPAPLPVAPPPPPANEVQKGGPRRLPRWAIIGGAIGGLVLLLGLLSNVANLLNPGTGPTATQKSLAEGLASSTPQPAPTKTRAPEPTPTLEPVELLVWYPPQLDMTGAIQNLAAEFERQHPNVTIILADHASGPIENALMSNAAPDVALTYGDLARRNSHLLLDLQELGYTQDELAKTFDKPAASALSFGDHIWGLPATEFSAVLYFNRALASEEDFPTDSQDIPGLFERAAAYRQRTGMPLLCVLPNHFQLAPILFGQGMPGTINDRGEILLSKAESIAAATYLRDVRELITLPALDAGDACMQLFSEGKVAAWLTSADPKYSIDTAKIDYGALPIGRPYVTSYAWMVSRVARDRGHAEMSLEFLRFITNADTQARLALVSGLVPANLAAQKNPDVLALRDMPARVVAANHGVAVPSYNLESLEAQVMVPAIEAILNSNQPIEAILGEAQAAFEEQLPPLLEPLAVELQVWIPDDHDYQRPGFEELGALLHERNPRISLVFTSVADLPAKLRAAVAAGEGPDLVYLPSGHLSGLQNEALELQTIGLDSSYMEHNYPKPVIDTISSNWQYWAIPMSQNGNTLVFNKSLAGPTDFLSAPNSFDELFEKAAIFREKNPGKELLCIPASGYFAAGIFFGYGVEGFVDENGNANLATEQAAAAATFLRKWREVATPGESYDDCLNRFYNGEVAALIYGPWFVGLAETHDIPAAILPFGKTYIDTLSWMVTTNAADRGNASAALEAVLYLGGPDSQELMALRYGDTPCHFWAFGREAVTSLPNMELEITIYSNGIGSRPTFFQDVSWGPVNDLVRELLFGDQPIDQLLSKAQDKIQRDLTPIPQP